MVLYCTMNNSWYIQLYIYQISFSGSMCEWSVTNYYIIDEFMEVVDVEVEEERE